jgi:hypothetical protein
VIRRAGEVRVLALPLAEAPARAGDAADASITQLRKAVISRPDGSHLTLLHSLRQLRDPDLRPLFVQLMGHRQWQVQVHAILALAEMDPEGRIDADRLGALEGQAQEAAIASALDLDLMGPDQIRSLLARDDVGQMPQLLLIGELLLLDEPVDPARLTKLMESADSRAAGLASFLAAQLGDGASLSAYRVHLADLSPADHRSTVQWLLPAIRQYRLTRALPWVLEVLANPEVDPQLALAGVRTALELDAKTGLEQWDRFLEEDAPYGDRVRWGLVLLASGADVPASAYDRLSGGEPLLDGLVRTGKARAGKSGVPAAFKELIDLGHSRTADWVLHTTGDLEPEQAAEVYLYFIEVSAARSQGQRQRIGRAVTATARLFEIAPDRVVERLAEVEDDSLTQEAMLLGLLDSSSPKAGQAAGSIRRIGAGHADSLALLLIAKHAEKLDPDDLYRLGMIAQGGGRVSNVLRTQAAWLYLKHTQSTKAVVAKILAES